MNRPSGARASIQPVAPRAIRCSQGAANERTKPESTAVSIHFTPILLATVGCQRAKQFLPAHTRAPPESRLCFRVGAAARLYATNPSVTDHWARRQGVLNRHM